MQKLCKLSIALALPLVMMGCAANETPIPLTETGVLAAFKPIANSSKAPCAMQKDVAEHNSAYDTLRTKRPQSYKAPCDVDKPKAKAPAAPSVS